MIFYLVPAANGEPQRLEGTQADANRVAKDRGLKVRAPQMQLDVPTDKTGLQAYINALMAIEVAAPAPLREDLLGNGEEYGLAPVVSHKPAFTQAQVDAMFEPTERTNRLTADDVDQVCILIEEMSGAAIGHIAHSLAARIERLGKEVTA